MIEYADPQHFDFLNTKRAQKKKIQHWIEHAK